MSFAFRPSSRSSRRALLRGPATLLALSLLSFAQGAGAQTAPTTLPDTPAGRMMTAWIAAINSANLATIQAFLDKNWPGQVMADNYLARAKATGGYNVGSIVRSTDQQIAALLQKRADTTAYNTVTVSVGRDNKVTGIVVGAGTARAAEIAPSKPMPAAEAEAAKTTAPYKQFAAWLEVFNSGDKARMQKYVEANWPNGSPASQSLGRERTGGYDLLALEQVTDTTLVGTMKEHNAARYVRFTLTLEPGDAHKIDGMAMTPIPKP